MHLVLIGAECFKFDSEVVFLSSVMNRIAEILLDWYAREGRDLPWRRTRDPYRIWLSEVILQQTRVAQGMEYYLRFTERFPDVASLAAAPEDEVLKLWQGLGYYSRARNLRAAAREVVERFGGVFPRSLDDVRSLRGVGDYTAAAICSAAYDAPCAVVDGNVYRVLSRLFDLAEPIDTTAGKRAGKHPSETLYDLTGGGPEVAGAAVIAQPLPEFQHLVLGRGGERRNVGKTLRETEVVLHPLRHAGLLEDHFREPDPVGIARTTPRQVTTLAGVPVEQYFGNAVHNGRQKYDFGIKFEAFRPN
jgi:endonuclease III